MDTTTTDYIQASLDYQRIESAIRYLETMRARGKVVISIAQ